MTVTAASNMCDAAVSRFLDPTPARGFHPNTCMGDAGGHSGDGPKDFTDNDQDDDLPWGMAELLADCSLSDGEVMALSTEEASDPQQKSSQDIKGCGIAGHFCWHRLKGLLESIWKFREDFCVCTCACACA